MIISNYSVAQNECLSISFFGVLLINHGNQIQNIYISSNVDGMSYLVLPCRFIANQLSMQYSANKHCTGCNDCSVYYTDQKNSVTQHHGSIAIFGRYYFLKLLKFSFIFAIFKWKSFLGHTVVCIAVPCACVTPFKFAATRTDQRPPPRRPARIQSSRTAVAAGIPIPPSRQTCWRPGTSRSSTTPRARMKRL